MSGKRKSKKTVIELKKPVIEDKIVEMYRILTINMGGKKPANERRKEVVSNITGVPGRPSVIFCQEVLGYFEEGVVEKCGNDDYSYKFARAGKEAVMWNEIDFNGDEVKCTDSSIKEIPERLQKERPDVDLSWVDKRATMVKLTSKKTGKSFLAVSWHGPHKKTDREGKLKAFRGLICYLFEVCKKIELSSFIIGGDFNLNTTSEDVLKCEGIKISRYELCNQDKEQRGRSFVRYKDTFIVSDECPLTVSSVKPLETKNALLDHVPVEGDLEVGKHSIKQDRGKLEQHFQSYTFRTAFVYMTVYLQSCDYAQII